MAEVDEELSGNVVHVAAARSTFRVDSTSSHLLPDDVILPSVSARVPWGTAVAPVHTNCSDPPGRCAPPDTVVVGVEPTMNGGSRTSVVGGGDATPSDEMASFRAALDAVDPTALVGLRRARSKSVLVPACRPPPAAVRFRSRGSVHCEQVARDDEVDADDDSAAVDQQPQQRRLYHQQQATAAKPVASSTYSTERFRSASLATHRSHRSRDSASMSEMCIEYMRRNGIIPRYSSLQQQQDDVIRSDTLIILAINRFV